MRRDRIFAHAAGTTRKLIVQRYVKVYTIKKSITAMTHPVGSSKAYYVAGMWTRG